MLYISKIGYFELIELLSRPNVWINQTQPWKLGDFSCHCIGDHIFRLATKNLRLVAILVTSLCSREKFIHWYLVSICHLFSYMLLL